MKKRLLSILLTLSLVTTLCVGLATPAAAAGYAGGSGTRNDPYLIATADQLARFRDAVNNGNTKLCAKLVADIDLKNQPWVPIGSSSISSTGKTETPYEGTFDGCGHLISNLNITTNGYIPYFDYYATHVAGLFGCIEAKGVVRCVGISGSFSGTITSSIQELDVTIGPLAGIAAGTVEECFSTCNTGTISIKSGRNLTIGGLIGRSTDNHDAVIRNCYTTGSISGTISAGSSSDAIAVGGLVGDSNGLIENTYSATRMKVSVSQGRFFHGGIVGASLEDIRIYHSYYDNQVSTARYVLAFRNTGYTPVNSLENSLNPNDCIGKTTAEMRSDRTVSLLGNAFRKDTGWVNQGYPVLSVMTYGETSGWSEWFDDEAMGTNINRTLCNKLTPPELKKRDLKKSISRVEFCAVAVQLYEEMGGRKLDASKLTTPFTDTSSDAVRKAYALGITNGTSPTTFDPYRNISREQLATMLTRVYKALNLRGWTLATDSQYKLDWSGTTLFADDKNISAYARPSVYFMVKNQVIKGTSPTTFSPRNVTSAQAAIGYANASREQALIMAVRMFQKL